MKVRTVISVLAIAASAAWAQSPSDTIGIVRRQVAGPTAAAAQRHEEAVRQLGLSSSGSQSSSPAARASAAQTMPQPREAKPAGKPSATHRVKASGTRKSTKVAAGSAKDEGAAADGTAPEMAVMKKNVHVMRGRRDPFQTIIRTSTPEVGCATGKRCLVVDRMDLKGIVHSQNGMIAIVSNQQQKTYFLHENDPVFNGQVVRINPDSVVFREMVVDRVGRQSIREVVKRIGKPTA